MSDQRSADFLAVCVENAELRQQLAGVQDQCVELAVDAGELHAKLAARLARIKQAHDDLISAAHRVQADAIEIEALAKRRLADEYDAAQARGKWPRTDSEEKLFRTGTIRRPSPTSA